MKNMILKTGTEQDFFKRGRMIAKAADLGQPIPEETIISFEDPADVTKLMTTARLALFRTVKECPGSITQISIRLRRDRSAVKRDIDELERAGLVMVSTKVLPGHGRMKEVSAVATRFSLQAVVY